MVERRHERLVAGLEQLRQEAIQRAARIDHRLAAHAVAGVEQHAEADGHPLVGELRDVLLVAVLENLEVVLRQPRDEAAIRIGDRHRDLDDVDAGAEGLGNGANHEGHEDREGHEGFHAPASTPA
jgi:hypothetical protein